MKIMEKSSQKNDITLTSGWIGVLLLDGFSSLSLGSILEPFATLQNISHVATPKIRTFSLTEKCVRSSGGISVLCDYSKSDVEETYNNRLAPNAIIICGPSNAHSDEQLIKPFLRRTRLSGIPLYGIGNGVWQMAKCGLLSEKTATLHWKCLSPFEEAFSKIDAVNMLYLTDNTGGTCAGETATLDMIIELIGSFAPEHKAEVCNALLISQVRPGNHKQPGSQCARLRHSSPILAKAVQLMAKDLEMSHSTFTIAKFCGVSVRQLERLFQSHLATTPLKYKTALRTERGKELLLHTDLSVKEVAFAVGFNSVATFSKHFRAHEGMSPSQFKINLALK